MASSNPCTIRQIFQKFSDWVGVNHPEAFQPGAEFCNSRSDRDIFRSARKWFRKWPDYSKYTELMGSSKNDTQSKMHYEVAMEYMLTKCYPEALDNLNKAIMLASVCKTPTSENVLPARILHLAKCHAYRSQVLFELELYKEAISEIEIAMYLYKPTSIRSLKILMMYCRLKIDLEKYKGDLKDLLKDENSKSVFARTLQSLALSSLPIIGLTDEETLGIISICDKFVEEAWAERRPRTSNPNRSATPGNADASSGDASTGAAAGTDGRVQSGSGSAAGPTRGAASGLSRSAASDSPMDAAGQTEDASYDLGASAHEFSYKNFRPHYRLSDLPIILGEHSAIKGLNSSLSFVDLPNEDMGLVANENIFPGKLQTRYIFKITFSFYAASHCAKL